METLGFVRRLDKLNRICIPKEVLNSLYWETGTKISFEYYLDGVFIRENHIDDAARKIDVLGRVGIPMTMVKRLGFIGEVEMYFYRQGIFIKGI